MSNDSFSSISELDSVSLSSLADSRQLFLLEDINPISTTNLVSNLMLLDQIKNDQEIIIYINSIGGDMDGLFTIYDTFQSIQSPIKTVCIGTAYSAAAVLLMSGDKGNRWAYPNSSIMIHDVQLEGLYAGDLPNLNKNSKRLKQESQSMMEMIACHTGQSLRKIKRDCKEDKYFTPKQALAYGLIDGIVPYTKKIPALIK